MHAKMYLNKAYFYHKFKNIYLILLLCLTSCTHSWPFMSQNEKQKELLDTELMLIHNLLGQGKNKQALVNLTNMKRKYPENAEVLELTGITHLILKNYLSAEMFLKKSYMLYPSPRSALNFSSCLIENKKLLYAQKILISIMKHESSHTYEYRYRLMHNLAITYAEMNQNKKAILLFKKALLENPLHYVSLLQLAQIYKKQKYFKKSYEYFNKSYQACGKCLEPLKNLISLQNHLKHNQKQKLHKTIKGYFANPDITKEQKQKLKVFVQQKNKQAKKELQL